MQNKTKIWRGIGACVLISVAASAIASQNDSSVNQFSHISLLSNAANSSMSNSKPAKPIVLMSSSGGEQGESGEGEKPNPGKKVVSLLNFT
ncbi:MAG: hypothetical protein HC849_16770 [Oscillatoriales cyanobacterium RU_3_3]|nr:hypothetical protein [Oscillatoriales cyanobacterium RU_3_3]